VIGSSIDLTQRWSVPDSGIGVQPEKPARIISSLPAHTFRRVVSEWFVSATAQ
jgi:hypothetical protein